ncbi:MAG: hypothetical protein JNL12_15855 [Planctomycetes bacterium]|nr:hypothetical protein [Planctomycetota bacterium]
MHNRQSGAAHVPMMFFLLLLILFLAAVSFAWINQTKNNELVDKNASIQQDINALKAKEILYQHYIEDVGNVIGMPGKYTGRKASEGVYEGASLEGMVGLINPQALSQVMDKALADAELAPAKGVENVLNSMATLVAQLKDRNREVNTKLDGALSTQARTADELRKKSADFETRARAYQEEIAKVRSDLEASHSRTQATLASATANVENIAKEKLAAEDAAAEKQKQLEKEIQQRDVSLAGLQKREDLRKAPHVADGRLLASQQGLRTAFIDLGRKDLLQAGTVFMVRSPALTTKDGPSASPVVKCKATVVRVEENRSEVELSDFADEVGDFPRAGDLLFNDLYSPRVTRTIYLMGRFQAPYQKEPLKLLLTRLGNKVVDKMGPGVDTVILGNDPLNESGEALVRLQDSEEYKLADKLHVEFQTLQAVRDFLKL